MNTERVGVAISTTGHEHRMRFLETCVESWLLCNRWSGVVVVTVDGDDAAVDRVRRAVSRWSSAVEVYQVGQPKKRSDPLGMHPQGRVAVHGRLGVAANKNTGIEILIDTHDVEHVFLSDDDIRPLYQQSLTKHMNMSQPHSMVMWGAHRLLGVHGDYAAWTWPRGVMLYVHRDVIYSVGGMVEEFGLGGHEHAEYSQRIHNAGLTPASFISPASYVTRNGRGASALWEAQDMPRAGEPYAQTRARKKANTTLNQILGDWEKINTVMTVMRGSSAYVGFRAHENGRASAILCRD